MDDEHRAHAEALAAKLEGTEPYVANGLCLQCGGSGNLGSIPPTQTLAGPIGSCPACHGTGAAAEPDAHEVGFSVGDLDHHGELELKLTVDGAEGSCWLSREMWEAVGARFGSAAEPVCSECGGSGGSKDFRGYSCPACKGSGAAVEAQGQQGTCVYCGAEATSPGAFDTPGKPTCDACYKYVLPDAEPQPPAEREASVDAYGRSWTGPQVQELAERHHSETATLRAAFDKAERDACAALAERDQLRRDLAQAEKDGELLCEQHTVTRHERDAARAELALKDKRIAELDKAWTDDAFALKKSLARAEDALQTSRALCDELRKACAEKDARIGELETQLDIRSDVVDAYAQGRELDLVSALGSGRDMPLPEDADISAAFPTRTGRHDLYAEAMRLVGAKHSKGALVALVNWLLAQVAEPCPNCDLAARQCDELNGLRQRADAAEARVREVEAVGNESVRRLEAWMTHGGAGTVAQHRAFDILATRINHLPETIIAIAEAIVDLSNKEEESSDRLQDTEAALERALGLARKWLLRAGPVAVIPCDLRECARELLAAIDGDATS